MLPTGLRVLMKARKGLTGDLRWLFVQWLSCTEFFYETAEFTSLLQSDDISAWVMHRDCVVSLI